MFRSPQVKAVLATFLSLWLVAAPVYAGSISLLGAGGSGGGAAPTTTFDPAHAGTGIVLSNGNLTATGGGTSTTVRSIASHSTGKFYVEFKLNAGTTPANLTIGIQNAASGNPSFLGNDQNSLGWSGAGNLILNSGNVAAINSYTTANTLCMALDLGNNAVWFRVGAGNWNNSPANNPATNTGGFALSTAPGLNAGPYFAVVGVFASDGDVWIADFGATAYSQTPPSGFSNW